MQPAVGHCSSVRKTVVQVWAVSLPYPAESLGWLGLARGSAFQGRTDSEERTAFYVTSRSRKTELGFEEPFEVLTV